jgi:hypothetical protein
VLPFNLNTSLSLSNATALATKKEILLVGILRLKPKTRHCPNPMLKPWVDFERLCHLQIKGWLTLKRFFNLTKLLGLGEIITV